MLENDNQMELLSLALAEKDTARRYGLLNAIAQNFARAETALERCFAAVCHELNGEPYAAEVCLDGIEPAMEGMDASFTASCVDLLYALKFEEPLDSPKQCFVKTVEAYRNKKDFHRLGLLLKIHRMLLEKFGMSPDLYFKNIKLPYIVVVKAFMAGLPDEFSKEEIEVCLSEANKLKEDVAFAICSCTNIPECRMMNIFSQQGAVPICAPLLPENDLRCAYLPDDASEIIGTMHQCELQAPVAEYFSDSGSWALIENHGTRHLLGLGLMRREETELPLRFVWADFMNSHAMTELEDICKNHGIDAMEIKGGQHA